MNENSAENPTSSSELMRWLQSLALPMWARFGLVVAFASVLLSCLSLVAWGVVHQDKESLTSAVGLLTVALPISLVVIGLVFGQRSEKRLADATEKLLGDTLPERLRDIVACPLHLVLRTARQANCHYRYELSGQGVPALQLGVEINVCKANVYFLLPGAQHWPLDVDLQTHELHPYRHVISGALAEGYTLNPHLARYNGQDGGAGLVFALRLPKDFLWRADARLYFIQDLSFFARGVLEAVLSQRASTERACA